MAPPKKENRTAARILPDVIFAHNISTSHDDGYMEAKSEPEPRKGWRPLREILFPPQDDPFSPLTEITL